MSEMSDSPAAGGETPEIQLLLDRAKELENEIYATTGWDDPMPEQAVLDKVNELDAKRDLVLNKIHEIRRKKQEDAFVIPEHVIVAFVETIDKAHRYFDLKQHLRECRYFEELNFSKTEVFEILFERVKDNNLFNNDEEDIWKAVQAHLKEVRVEGSRVPQYERMKNYREHKLRQFFGNASEYTAEQHDEIDSRFPGLIWREPDISDGYALSHPVYNLVYQAREEGYVMNEDLRVEIRNVKKADPRFYYDHFIYRKPPMKYSDKKVLVTFSSLAASIYDITDFVSSCGHVVHYEVISAKPTKVARITFKDSQEAQRAVLLESPKVNGKPVKITPCQPAFDPAESKDVRNASDMKYAVNEAFYIYNVFRSYRGKPSTKVVIDRSAKDAIGVIDKPAKEGGEMANVKDPIGAIDKPAKEGGEMANVKDPIGAIDKTAADIDRSAKDAIGAIDKPAKEGGEMANVKNPISLCCFHLREWVQCLGEKDGAAVAAPLQYFL